MKKIIYCMLILGFLTSCKECNPGQKEPEASFEVEGVYSVHERRILDSLIKGNESLEYAGICLEIHKPDTAVVRFVGLKEVKDISMKWSKVEEGKYKIDYKDKEAFFYDYRMHKDPKHPDLTYMVSLKSAKPIDDDTNSYTTMTKYFNDTLDDCTSYKREEMSQEPDPGPDN
ncbi:hypothetical protein FH587_20115 [Leptospira interrogans]|uniref:hypothetical protein n=1 Tax=Leptospira interrogans TaxID=173 RepID=UPI001F07FA4F|nr:hypothetical protein [Leptospira interrogans]UML84280.1 hypothetical protein FH587_20035 [Leptospira interrogans]UML84296.1 hypothetical protein FH587_20115 [Leptospira interrogans]